MLISLLAMGTLLIATKLFAAENPFEKNYKAQNNTNLVSLQAKPDTKMYVSNHKDDDNISRVLGGDRIHVVRPWPPAQSDVDFLVEFETLPDGTYADA